MSSLRRQLNVSLITTLVIALGLAGALLHVLLAEALVAEFDAALDTKARSLGALLEADGELIEFDYNRGLLPAFAEDDLFELWSPGEVVYCRSDSLGEADLPRVTGDLSRPETFDLTLPDGRAGRALGLRVEVVADDELGPYPPPPVMEIVIARSRAELDARLATLDTSLVAVGLLAVLLLGLGVSRAVQRSLAPLHALGARVDAVQVSTLGRSLGTAETPVELLPFVAKLDELMERLAAAFARQRRMTDAMAHELRTPVAELRSASDVARRWPDDGELSTALAETAAEVATRMGAAIEAILHTSRLEAGEDCVDRVPLALAALVDEAWAPWQAGAAERGVRLDNSIDGGLVLVGDRRLLGLVLSNLLGNAASFSAPGTLTAGARGLGQRLELELSNPAVGLSADDVAHLEEPFWRKDAARTGGEHSGLGLSLVRAILTTLGGELAFAVDAGSFTVRVTIPAPSSARNPGASDAA